MNQQIADQETSSDAYATRFSGKIGQWFLDTQSAKVAKCLRQHSLSSVLEIGGGHGQLVQTYLALGLKPTIYASSPVCAHRVQTYINANAIDFKVGNLIDLPYPDKSFDAVVAIRLLTHCDEWQVLVKEMCRVAKSVVVIDFPPTRSFNILYKYLYKIKAKHEGNTREFTLFPIQAIANEFKHHDFVLRCFLPQFFFPMVVYRKIKNLPLAKVLESLASACLLTRFFGSPVIASFKRREI